jgi:hypothetical protein
MKHLTFLFALSAFTMQQVKSQDSSRIASPGDTLISPVFYKASIFQTFHQVSKGYLVTISDSSVFLSENKIPVRFENVNTAHFGKFDYRNIEKIKLSKPHVKATALIVGAVVGIGVGAIIGYSNGDDTGLFAATAGEKAVFGGLVGGGAGVLIGGIIARASEKTYLINGEWRSLQELKDDLQKK